MARPLLGKKPFMIHYGGNWETTIPGKINSNDYKGGMQKYVKVDGDEFCLIDLKRDVQKLVGEGVGFQIASIIQGYICRITQDKDLMYLWDELKPEKDKKYHIFVFPIPTSQKPTRTPVIPSTAAPVKSPTKIALPVKSSKNNVPPVKSSKPMSPAVKSPQKIPPPVKSSKKISPTIKSLKKIPPPVNSPQNIPSPVPTTPKNKSVQISQSVRRSPRFTETPQPSQTSVNPTILGHNGERLVLEISDDEVAEDVEGSKNMVESQLPPMDQDFCTHNIHEYLDELEHASEGLNDVENVENMVYESDNTELNGELNGGLNGELNGELNDGLNGEFNGGLNDELNAGSDDEGDKYKYDKTFGPVFGSWMDAGYDSAESASNDDEYNPTDSDYSDNDLDNDIDPMVVDEEVHNLEEELQGSVLANVMGLSRNIYEEEEVAKVADPVVEKFGLCELKPKMSWPTVEACREFFVTMAIKHRFSFRQVRNDKFMVILVCKELSYKMRDHPDFKPTDIVKEVFNKYGVSISYWTTWRSRWLMLEAMHGNYEEGYRLVPELCRQILKRNPGSIAKHFVSDGTKSFIGVAVAFKSSIDGWLNGCRPIVGFDGCFLKGKYGGCCLTAIGLDAMNGIFPLAVYVCQGENKDTWMQLLCHLKPHLDKHKDKVIFMSDDERGVDTSL
ncbi:hypothetical protein IFM89_008776 [Coptis chinensis]|uniref:MULE transposase domain-containing protein n=1 Tax=Coptis chinensis TaxID=261450 RepID=A0A835GVK8_9MAGN|nr:hypothetical protein IFM89_008776 [Coptis chinensis]